MDAPTRDDDALQLDAVLELLASRWCRYVLYEIHREEPLAPETLVRRVAAREYDTSETDRDSSSDPDSDPNLDSDQLETVRTRLYHNSLPKLEAHDIVEWDVDEIARGECASIAEPYVEWAKKWELDQ